MILFECDYQEGAHPRILEKLVETNMVSTIGYSGDRFSAQAREMIKTTINCPTADVHFLVGGTQTNMTFIASILRPHQGVISADTGHINVHESGAIESTGHKVLSIPSIDGKLNAAQVEKYHADHWNDASFEHTVQPGLVYISLPTENGTLYSKAELTELYATCKRLELPLYIDGARLGYGMASPVNDITFEDLPTLCDAFYIGGTKQGALFGEALVILNDKLKKDIRYIIKQKGGLLAKGRLLGLQFIELFTDNLYQKLSNNAVTLALEIKDALKRNGVELLYDSYTNQQFPILRNDVVATLREKYVFLDWAPAKDGYTTVRFCTSWATTKENVDTLIADLDKLL